eukprot:715806-Alexandrium_andersonii.AAC.1
MSASLVGSEMCIRDRDVPNHEDINHNHCMRVQQGSGRDAAGVYSARGETCLLYTSDAADDM